MKNCLCIILFISMMMLFVPMARCSDLPLDQILQKVEARFAGTGFSARFDQVSTIKAMDIKDRAKGSLLVKRPGKMKWEYETPEPQSIITDGINLWVYRPGENQVMKGVAPEFFADGKGASFLSDMRQIRKKFNISLSPDRNGRYVLKLLPIEKQYDIRHILLEISKQTFDIDSIVTYNSYDDENRINLEDYKHNLSPDDSNFNFIIPFGTDVLRLEE